VWRTDKLTNRQTSCHDIVHVMHTHRAVKIVGFWWNRPMADYSRQWTPWQSRDQNLPFLISAILKIVFGHNSANNSLISANFCKMKWNARYLIQSANFENPRWRTAAILKLLNRHMSIKNNCWILLKFRVRKRIPIMGIRFENSYFVLITVISMWFFIHTQNLLNRIIRC